MPDRRVLSVFCGDKEFRVTGWHTAQADQFKDFIVGCGDHFTLQVHGDGLIAHMMRLGAVAYQKGKDNGG